MGPVLPAMAHLQPKRVNQPGNQPGRGSQFFPESRCFQLTRPSHIINIRVGLLTREHYFFRNNSDMGKIPGPTTAPEAWATLRSNYLSIGFCHTAKRRQHALHRLSFQGTLKCADEKFQGNLLWHPEHSPANSHVLPV